MHHTPGASKTTGRDVGGWRCLAWLCALARAVGASLADSAARPIACRLGLFCGYLWLFHGHRGLVCGYLGLFCGCLGVNWRDTECEKCCLSYRLSCRALLWIVGPLLRISSALLARDGRENCCPPYCLDGQLWACHLSRTACQRRRVYVYLLVVSRSGRPVDLCNG